MAFGKSPNVSRSGIWMSGGSNNLYLITGNGTYDGTAKSDYGDTLLKLSTSGGVSVADWFTPADESSLEGGDTDSGPVPHLVIGGGKEGNLFLLNRDNMGKFNTTNQVVQTLAFGQSIFATAAFWSNSLYLAGVSGHLKTYSFNTATGMFHPSAASQSPTSYGFPGASPAVSSSLPTVLFGRLMPPPMGRPAVQMAQQFSTLMMRRIWPVNSGTAHRLSPAATKPATPSSSPCPPLPMAKSMSAHAPNSPSSAFYHNPVFII
ncbi:MAG TPA: hypothetical protein VIW93_10725 [Candidatus Acidoferrum sp.]